MDIFGIGAPELVVIMVVALVFLGPQRLPEVARTAGRAIYELRQMVQPAQEMIREVMETAQYDPMSAPRQQYNEQGEPVGPDGQPYPVDLTGIHPMFRRDATAIIPPELLPEGAAVSSNGTEAGAAPTLWYPAPGDPVAAPPPSAPSSGSATLWYPAPGDPNAPAVRKSTAVDTPEDYPQPGGGF
jgi:Tat protein translocase TatB subunit